MCFQTRRNILFSAVIRLAARRVLLARIESRLATGPLVELDDGQAHVEARADAFRARGLDLPSVRFDQLLDEREADAQPPVPPNPSPANAHFTPRDLVGWYDRLADFVAL